MLGQTTDKAFQVSWAGGGVLAFIFTNRVPGKSTRPDHVTLNYRSPRPGVDAMSVWDTKGFPQPIEHAVDVVSPFTNEMLSQYELFRVDEVVEKIDDYVSPPLIFYYVTGGGEITAENYADPYPGTDQCGTPVTQSGAYGGTFFNCQEVLIPLEFRNPMPERYNGGHFRSQEAADYFAAAFNAFQSASGFGYGPLSTGSFPLRGELHEYTGNWRVVFFISIRKLKQAFAANLPPGIKLPDVNEFFFDVGATTPGGVFAMSMSSHKTRKEFPLTEPDPTTGAVDFDISEDYERTSIAMVDKKAGLIKATINFKTLEVTLEADLDGGIGPQ